MERGHTGASSLLPDLGARQGLGPETQGLGQPCPPRPRGPVTLLRWSRANLSFFLSVYKLALVPGTSVIQAHTHLSGAPCPCQDCA